MDLVQLMLEALKFFYSMVPVLGYGFAIIILTLVIKALFWQMTEKQYISMAAMRKFQPKLKELQVKHKDNPKKLQEEMMVLYKEHGVNPFAGCLPMLIQIPIMIILFSALNKAAFWQTIAPSAKQFLWIKDISLVETAKLGDVFNSSFVFGNGLVLPLLAILVALSTYYMQKTMDMDPEQRQMMMFMPVIMLFICYNLSAGVLIYWVVSNLATAFQQVYVKKHKIKEPIGVIDVTPLKTKAKKKK